MTKIEYRVRPVTRYIVTRWEGTDDPRAACSNGSSTLGEYDNADTAYEVGYALCKAEHDRLGYPPNDERVQYPRHPNDPFGNDSDVAQNYALVGGLVGQSLNRAKSLGESLTMHATQEGINARDQYMTSLSRGRIV